MLGRVLPLPFTNATAAVPFWVVFVGFCVAEAVTQLRSRRNRGGTAADRRSLLLVVVCAAVAFNVAFLPGCLQRRSVAPSGRCLSPGWS